MIISHTQLGRKLVVAAISLMHKSESLYFTSINVLIDFSKTVRVNLQQKCLVVNILFPGFKGNTLLM